MYANWIDPKTKKQKGRQGITLEEFRKFIGICGFIAVREQPQMYDYWSNKTNSLHCDEVAGSLSQNKFNIFSNACTLKGRARWYRIIKILDMIH